MEAGGDIKPAMPVFLYFYVIFSSGYLMHRVRVTYGLLKVTWNKGSYMLSLYI
jgi:hypothetical protein